MGFQLRLTDSRLIYLVPMPIRALPKKQNQYAICVCKYCVYEEIDFKALAYAIVGASEASLVSVGQTSRLQTLARS